MIPELGHFALILALTMSLLQSAAPLLARWLGSPAWNAVVTPAARAHGALLLVAYACLTWSFAARDFSVAYVAANSNSALPLFYRISGVWGGHEGSILLWAVILAGWTVAVSVASRSLPETFRARVIAVMGMVSSGFILFMLATSNPFDRLVPAPADGRDLNPLLQDPGMIIHPPMLYMGYVGMCVPFAFACAALLEGRVDTRWTRWTRPWTTVAWVFLTCGIALGSWWAYNELGWGGWWFWDPVENASFMPWLVATALVHSLAVTEQRGAFRAWTVLLAIAGFSLSLLGTFLVRSGVLVSVHAFATDPARGVFILCFLAAVVGGALTLFAMRAERVSGGGGFAVLSRETLLLVNNVLLAVASATVLLGTLYPLIVDALGLGKISVGPPYFDRVFVPLMLPLLLLVGIGPLARWKRDAPGRLGRMLRAPAVLAAAALIAVATLVPRAGIVSGAAIALAVWIAGSTVLACRARLRAGGGLLSGLARLPRSFVGMVVAHLGVAAFTVGVTLTSALGTEADVRLAPGGAHEVDGYRVVFRGVAEHDGPNYRAQRGEVELRRDGRVVAVLHPEKRTYPSQQQPMTEAAVDTGFTRDVYVALGEPVGDGAWAVRVQVKPFVRWIWGGALVMALGGLIAATDRRYRQPAAARARAVPPSDARLATPR